MYAKISMDNLNNPDFVLKYYQVLPKYYLYNHVDELILHYSMGSGKTLAAINTALPWIYKQINQPIDEMLGIASPTNKVLIVGPGYSTTTAFQRDLINPNFNLFEYLKFFQVKKSYTDADLIKDYKILASDKIKKWVTFTTYQKLFNMCFPNISTKSYIQNIDSLLIHYKNNNISIDESFLKTLENTIIIVDEMQRMYTSSGMNSWGFAIGCLTKVAQKYNIKFLFLTGTMLNTSTSELPIIMSILNHDDFLQIDNYIEYENVFGSNIPKLCRSSVNELVNFFKDKMLFYDNSKATNTTDNIQIKEFNDHKEIVTISSNIAIPVEKQIGQHITKEKIMNLYTLEPEDYQAKRFREIKIDNSLEIEFDDETVDETISIHDGIFDETDPKVIKNNGIFTGDCLKYPYIKKYSAIGAFAFKKAYDELLQKKKTILYHHKINGFGLRQYVEIFKQNGFIEYHGKINNNTLCCTCGKRFEEHISIKHQFEPMCYGILSGQQTDKERSEIMRAYNYDSNKYGHDIGCLFISSVASTGVTFKNTNNMIILSKINSLSLWRQIKARIIRAYSHQTFPPHLRYGNIYTMILKGEETYYDIRSKLYQDTITLLDSLNNESNTELLFHKSLEFQTNTSDKYMIEDDIIKALDNLLAHYTFVNHYGSSWSVNNFYDFLVKNGSYYTSYDFKNISKFEVVNALIRCPTVIIFQSTNKQYYFEYNMAVHQKDGTVYNVNPTQENDYLIQKSLQLQFHDIKNIIQDNSNIIIELLKNLPTTENSKLFEILNKIVMFNKMDYKCFLDITNIKDYMFKIYNEYYPDDDKNFILNRTKRSVDKSTGFYFFDKVILYSGDTIQLDKTKTDKNITFLKEIPYKFSILSYKKNDKINWNIRLLVNKKSCIHYFTKKDNTLFKEIFKINDDTNLEIFCQNLITKLCEYVISTKEENKIFTPWM